MRHNIILFLLLSASSIFAQNLDYNSRITTFYAGYCGNETGDDEHTWYGFLSDNTGFTNETSSGCVQRNTPTATTYNGNWAVRNRTNVPVTQMRARIDGWEDDNSPRCSYTSGWLSGDDCRRQTQTYQTLSNPNEYAYQTATWYTGSTADYRLRATCSYRYSSTSLSGATDYYGSTLIPGGNRPFWGSRGNWAYTGSDCAASGTITHNQTSSFSTTVTCKSQVNFRWRVSSQANADYLYVFVNGVKKDSISGTVGWTFQSIALDYGVNNTIEWRYVKDGSGSSGLDRGMVDAITFTNANSLVAGTISGDQYIAPGGTPTTLLSTAPAQVYSPTMNYQWQRSADGVTWVTVWGATADSCSPGASTSTYYYRRSVQDACGNTGYSDTVLVSVMPFVARSANDTSVGYITDGGWHHFYNANNEIIFSLSGNLSGATSTPTATITRAADDYADLGTPANCTTGPSPGDAKFEMQRSWNLNFPGIASGTYSVRFYYLQSEKDSIVNAVAAHKAAYTNCTYANFMPGADGFFWFKNIGSAYAAPSYDTSTVLSGTEHTISGNLKYAQLGGITSFSGGSGAIIITPLSYLPVELVDFEGERDSDGRVILRWSTASEENNKGFHIQRSKDNIEFKTVGYVEGGRNSQRVLQYRFIDDRPSQAIYYRLKQVDLDDKYTNTPSIVIPLRDVKDVQVASLYPNPTNGNATMTLRSEYETDISFFIIDGSGAVLLRSERELTAGFSLLNLNLTNYRNGVYYIILTTETGVHRKKIVVAR